MKVLLMFNNNNKWMKTVHLENVQQTAKQAHNDENNANKKDDLNMKKMNSVND